MQPLASSLEDFALGCYGRGIEIQAQVPEHVASVVAERTRRLTGRTGCGICGADSITAVLKELHPVSPGGVVAVDAIHRALLALTARQTYNTSTGTVHAAAWAGTQGDIQVVREDVGRTGCRSTLIPNALSDPDRNPESRCHTPKARPRGSARTAIRNAP